jgi:methylenetetrahydrofolate dehydrogenase (NADP+)/methenyltetrahydrofolate cyclohydrolase
MPTGTLLENSGCTLLGLHSESIDCPRWTREADILVVATGVKHLVGKEWIKRGAIVIDVGIHRDGNRLTGDVKYDEVKQVASFITPVPGGVGPMTIAMLVRNSLRAYEVRMGIKELSRY